MTRLSDLIVDFKRDFPQPTVMSLPKILSTISTSTSRQSDNHFFAAVVVSKDLINLYHEVVLWMLKRDLLITLHLRIRVVATADLKLRVKMARDMSRRKRNTNYKNSIKGAENTERIGYDSNLDSIGVGHWLSLSPKSARRHSRRMSSSASRHSQTSEMVLEDDSYGEEDDLAQEESDLEDTDVGWGGKEDTIWPSMISNPGRASPLERKWLSAMSEDKEEYIASRFEQ